MNSFTLYAEDGPLEFTQPGADGVMYCNGEPCFAEGRIVGPHYFVVGHRTLKKAAQQWYLQRSQLVEAYTRDLKSPWPFMQKETIDATSEPAAAQGNGGGGEGPLDARYP